VIGEKLSSDESDFESFKTEFQKEIAEKGLNREQVYNVDESGLYWKSLPKKNTCFGARKRSCWAKNK